MQYELMIRLGSSHGCVTVVGDPDQSSMWSLGGLAPIQKNCCQLVKSMVGDQQVCLFP